MITRSKSPIYPLMYSNCPSVSTSSSGDFTMYHEEFTPYLLGTVGAHLRGVSSQWKSISTRYPPVMSVSSG